MYLEHSVESLARGGPWRLGVIVPGISRWRVLKEAETEIHGGSSRRRLYGCTVTMLHPEAPPEGCTGTILRAPLQGVGGERLGAAGSGTFGPGPPVFEQLLLTWSQVSHQLIHNCEFWFDVRVDKLCTGNQEKLFVVLRITHAQGKLSDSSPM